MPANWKLSLLIVVYAAVQPLQVQAQPRGATSVGAQLSYDTTLGAGADWLPGPEDYDSSKPANPVTYSEDEKQDQRVAGTKLVNNLANATSNGTTLFMVPPGVYRLTNDPGSLIIENTVNFVFSAAGVELIAELDGNTFRLLGNVNLTIQGSQDAPLIIDADPIPWSQGVVTGSSNVTNTIDFRPMDGYQTVTAGGAAGRIELFTPDGVMLPHTQDPIQDVQQLDNGTTRLTMNSFTFGETLPPHGSLASEPEFNIFAPGNLISIEYGGHGGIEMRNNTGLSWIDVQPSGGALFWAGNEYGDDLYQRFMGIRRPGTNRLMAGGWLLQTFYGGSLTVVDSEIGHNFDDITDINSPPSYAFQQQNDTSFYMSDTGTTPVPLQQLLTLYTYPDLARIGQAKVVSYANDESNSANQAFANVADSINVRNLGNFRQYTVDTKIDPGKVAFVDLDLKPKCMKFLNSYFHDGLAGGIQPKGAGNILIQNCVVERTNLQGIGVGMDPFWWEGVPANNIQVINNTVIDAIYVPGVADPSITVYAGTPNPNATTPVNTNVQVEGNLVIRGAGTGIDVRLATNVSITNNVLAPAKHHFNGFASLYVDSSAPQALIQNNTFINMSRKAWGLPIATGPVSTPIPATNVSNNNGYMPSGALPDGAWRYVTHTDANVTLKGPWTVDPISLFPNDKTSSASNSSVMTFNFSGTEVAVRGYRDTQSGLANITLDGGANTTVDLSSFYSQATVVFRSESLPDAKHSLQITPLGKGGNESDNGKAVPISGFWVLNL